MSEVGQPAQPGAAGPGDAAPGDVQEFDVAANLKSYVIGLLLAALLTVASFWAQHSHLIWAPGIGVALGVLAVAQMGVHLVFFLHITTGPDNTNNVLALAFGVLIVSLLMIGSLWIMANLNRQHMPVNPMMSQLSSLQHAHRSAQNGATCPPPVTEMPCAITTHWMTCRSSRAAAATFPGGVSVRCHLARV